MPDTFAVTVERNGEKVVTIETNCLSGREISQEDEAAIRDAARSLLAFIGDPPPLVVRRIERRPFVFDEDQ